MEYDAFELCSPELKEKLTPARDLFENLRQKKIEKELVSSNFIVCFLGSARLVFMCERVYYVKNLKMDTLEYFHSLIIAICVNFHADSE